MVQLLVKPTKAQQVHAITPESAGWKYVGLELYDLQQKRSWYCSRRGVSCAW